MSGQRKALIVASDEYEHEGLRRLLAPAADAAALGRVLSDPQIGDFAVQVVHNQPAHIIQAQIEDLLSDSHPDDMLLLHFSCHGLKSDSGELFFAARNTRPNRLGSTAIAADFVQRCLRSSRSRSIVLLLDCCYGGAFSQGVTVRAAGDVNVLDSFPSTNVGGGRGRAVITASSAMEYAFEGERLAGDHTPRPSVFTQALVNGLATGDADRDEDGWISLNELYDYVFDKVRERNPHQTPSRDVEMQGELYVARSRRQRIRAAPLPPDLEAARKDKNMYTRRGAVSELRSRLLSDDLPVAVGAWEALTEMVSDIQYVADEARAALREAVVNPAESELNFGRLIQGSPLPHRIVHLLGPPIARACRPMASHAWIHIKDIAGGFDIAVDPVQAGLLKGRLNIKGPTGQAAITIQADVVPAPAEAPVSKPTTDAIPESTPLLSHVPSRPENHVPDDPSELGTAEVSDLAKYLSPDRSLKVGDRSIKAEQTVGPLIFEVADEDGERTCSEVRQLPVWAARSLIESYAAFPGMHDDDLVDGNAYSDLYSWLEALLAAQKRPNLSITTSGNRSVRIIPTVGPLRYIVFDGHTEQAYSSLNDVPDIDQFEPALLENAKQEMESLRIRERRAQVQRRLDEMLAASEVPTTGRPQTTTPALAATETADTVKDQQPSDPASGRLALPWRFAIGGMSPGLAYDGFRIALVGNGDQVVALDPANGGMLWRTREFPVLTAAAPVIDGDTMLIAGGDQHLWALDVNTGAIRTQVSLNASPTASPTVISGLAVIPTEDGCLTALDYRSGGQVWRKEFSQPIFGPVTTDGRALYVAGHDCHIRAWPIDAEKLSISSDESWSFRARKWFDNAPTIYGNSLFVGGYDGRLHCLDRRTGKNQGYWYYQAGGIIKGKPAVSHNVVAFGCYDGFVYAIDVQTRQERWPPYQAGSAIKAGVLILGSIIYAASRDGVLHMIDLRNGQGIGTYATGGAINVTPLAAGRFVIVGSDNGAVCAMDGKTLTGPEH